MGSARSAPLHAGGQRQRDRDEGADSDGDAPGAVCEVLDHSSAPVCHKDETPKGGGKRAYVSTPRHHNQPIGTSPRRHQYHRPTRTASNLSARTGRQDTLRGGRLGFAARNPCRDHERSSCECVLHASCPPPCSPPSSSAPAP